MGREIRRQIRRAARKLLRLAGVTTPAPPFPGWQTEPGTQIEWGLGYIKDTYGREPQ